LLTCLSAAPSAAPARAKRSWAQAEIRTVVAHGLMASSVAAFRPNDPLTQGDLRNLLAGLSQESPPASPQPSASPGPSVTMAQLDARLIRALGFGDEASSFYRAAAAAGLRPPARFGSEVVARLLGLRTNHPAGQDDLERVPSDPAPRAEAAYSAAQVLRLSDWDKRSVEEAAAGFELPVLTPWQRRVLTTAVGFIGFPYVWGGESETTSSPYGPQVHGGFDCSGFVWRVFKLQAYPNEGQLADVLQGRTTYAMSGEVKRAKRISLAKLQPADVIFFGAAGPKSKPAQVNHMGIYLGNGWFIHSSVYGVAVVQLSGWYAERFAWARRPLAEAGLVSAS
jgi:cell wall-associated NlpC family hydrolase